MKMELRFLGSGSLAANWMLVTQDSVFNGGLVPNSLCSKIGRV